MEDKSSLKPLYDYTSLFNYQSPFQFLYRKVVNSLLDQSSKETNNQKKAIFEFNPFLFPNKKAGDAPIDLRSLKLPNSITHVISTIPYIGGFWILVHGITFARYSTYDFEYKRSLARGVFKRWWIPFALSVITWKYWKSYQDYNKAISQFEYEPEAYNDIWRALRSENIYLSTLKKKYQEKTDEIKSSSKSLNKPGPLIKPSSQVTERTIQPSNSQSVKIDENEFKKEMNFIKDIDLDLDNFGRKFFPQKLTFASLGAFEEFLY